FAPFQTTPGPTVGTRLQSMPKGWGATGTYNFSRMLGLSVDAGGNYQDLANESTIMVGPRFMYRGEGVNYFVHTMLGLNRLSPKGVPSSNGLGAVLGGGMDLKLFKALSWRLFEADWVWGHENFASVAPANDANLRRPDLSGARLRTGLVM